MDRYLELHDSTFSGLKAGEGIVTVHLGRAYVHESAGAPGPDPGTGWLQAIDLVLYDAKVVSKPDVTDVWISQGTAFVNKVRHDNMLKLPADFSGTIELDFVTEQAERFRCTASRMRTVEVGAAEFFEAYKSHALKSKPPKPR